MAINWHIYFISSEFKICVMSSTYAVIFSSKLKMSIEGYQSMAQKIESLAKKQPGFLGMESVREGERGITISYWDDLQSIKDWKHNPTHLEAQKQGKQRWYQSYQVRICHIEKSYSFEAL